MGGRGGASGNRGGGGVQKAVNEKMPALAGSEKQVKWAEEIRRQALEGVDSAVEKAVREDKSPSGVPERLRYPTTASINEAKAEYIAVIKQATNAKDFIDNRNRFTRKDAEAMIIGRARGIDEQKGRKRRK